MVNHTRTLLLNKSWVDVGLTTELPFAEYVTDTYTPANLSPQLEQIRSTILFGAEDPADELVSMRAVIPFLHTAILEPITLSYDKRITYQFNPFVMPADLVIMMNSLIRLIGDHSIASKLWCNESFVPDMYKLYTSNAPMPIQLGAIMLALSYQIEKMRNGF